MSRDYDKQEWQEQQAARDDALEKQREKDRKSRARAARKYQRKLERLHRTLTEQGAISDFEDEFGTSVLERLETYGSAFHDLEKGRSGDALSFAQKSVLSAMNKKVKALKAAKTASEDKAKPETPQYSSLKPRPKKRSSFQKSYTPRVRHIEDGFDEDTALAQTSHTSPAALTDHSASGPNIVNLRPNPKTNPAAETPCSDDNAIPTAKKPFLRLVP